MSRSSLRLVLLVAAGVVVGLIALKILGFFFRIGAVVLLVGIAIYLLLPKRR